MTSSKPNLDYDVMIVGGGPAGISTWLHLQKYAPDIASRTVLIEKEKYPRDKLCGGALGGWTETALKKLGIEIKTPSISIHNVECHFGKDIYNHKERNFFRIVRRFEFDHALAQMAVDGGLQLHEDESFLDMRHHDNTLVVKTDKRNYKVNALIGADGSLSAVRRKMKLSEKSHLAPAIEIFAPVDPTYDPEFENNAVTIDFSPISEGIQGYVWHFPCIVDGVDTMNHGIGDFRVNRNQSQASIKKIFTRELQARNIYREPKLWSSHPIRWLAENDTISHPNIILVGDAAGIDPAAGGGIHLAISYGELAAQTIYDAYELDDFSFRDYEQRLQTHLVGKYIKRLTALATEMYSLKINPLDAAKEIFSKN